MKNVLLATDLATSTNRAFERSIKLATTMAAKLHIVHICPLYSFFKNKKQTISLKQDAEDIIKTELNSYSDVKKLHTTVTVIEGGETFAAILDQADLFHPETVKGEAYSCFIRQASKVQSELMATGTHGHVSLMPYKLGGTAKGL